MAMTWARVGKSAQGLAARSLLLCFTVFLALKIDKSLSFSWWFVFVPLWLFHVAVARHRFSLPAPLLPHGRQWAPCHAVVATPLLVSFELLICIYLENIDGDVDALGWWELFITLGIAESFAFLVCTKWFNPLLHRSSLISEASSSSTIAGYHSLISGLPSSMERHNEDRVCGLQDIGSHAMKVPVVLFQILLCMRLEGTPPATKDIPIVGLFLLVFIVQGLGILFATWRLLEKLFILLRKGSLPERYHTMSRNAYNLFAGIHHGSRLLGWWSTDERSKEEQAFLVSAGSSGYDTFCGYSPDVVKKMTKKDLTQEVWRLQAALGEQTEISKYAQKEYEKLQNEKVLCRICFEEEICVVLLPCRHHILCKSCSEKCNKCPICRVIIEERMQLCEV
ncbi:uncharacterized protein LOC141843489 [Curcuma longa]|uniref:uncharacterized protein LOC141843489 n=1 Tax=Curcuma longa TaxID=136217 RepID=UPI003D9EDD0F